MSKLALPPWIGIVVVICVCAAALWKGRRPEQTAAFGLIVGWLATILLRHPDGPALQWGGLAVDIAFFGLLTVIALRSDRWWPLWAAAFQLLGVITHAARLLDSTLGRWVYITAGVIWTYLVVAALAVGLWGRFRDEQRQAKAD